MSKAIRGDSALDHDFALLAGDIKKGTRPEILRNIDQKGLRDMLCTLRIAEAKTAKYLDMRNEQGRGALGRRRPI